MKLTILLRRSRANRAAKTTKAGECCMGLLQAGFLCRLKNPFDGTNAKRGKQLYCHRCRGHQPKGGGRGVGRTDQRSKGWGRAQFVRI